MNESLTAYEQQQRRQNLTVLILVGMVISFLLGLYDLQFHSAISVTALFAMSALCILLYFLNRAGHWLVAASLFSAVALAVIFLNLYDGDGLYDTGMLAYPIFILVGTLLFGRNAVLPFTLAALASVTGITILQEAGYIHPTFTNAGLGDLIPIFLLFLMAGSAIWVILTNAQNNLRKVKDAQSELEQNYDQTLAAWARVLEIRDRETEGHSRRLVELSARLGAALGLPEEELVHLRRGALVHDIGKLAIPDQILLKQGPLDDDEMEIIHKHPTYARDMLKRITFLEPCVSVAYSHHEWWGGRGYPQGLKGEEIPLLARIFAVVDAYDALGADRPYRSAWPHDEIIAYLRDNAGVIYDPHIVEVFLGMI
jgi:hypothetical protein